MNNDRGDKQIEPVENHEEKQLALLNDGNLYANQKDNI